MCNIDEVYEKSLNAIKKIESIDLKSESSYFEIYNIIKKEIAIPFVIQTIPSGTNLFRARLNTACPFTFKSEISYNLFLKTISNGRANNCNQPVFYASLTAESAISETSKILASNILNQYEYLTIGRWLVNKPINVAVIFNDIEFLSKNDTIFKNYYDAIRKNTEFVKPNNKKILDYISKEFAKKVHSSKKEEYKISCAFFNIILENLFISKNVGGVLYPSIQFEKEDLNVALIPEIVDECLALEHVSKYRVRLIGNTVELVQVGISDIISFSNKNIEHSLLI